jgi:hypothetical protein
MSGRSWSLLAAILIGGLLSSLQAQDPSDSYVPLDTSEKAKVFGSRIISPHGFAASAFRAGWNHWENSPEEWEQGMEGYSRRLGHKMASKTAKNLIGFAAATVFREDPRYFPAEGSGFWKRSGHAIADVFTTRKDSGKRSISIWRFAGIYGSQFVSNTWRPAPDSQASDALVRGTISIGFDTAQTVFKEFWPDIRRTLFRR